MNSSLIRLSGGLAAAFSLTVAARAAVVLTINVQDPSHVTFAAVANNSAINGTLVADFNGGISLLGFFTADQSILTASPLAISGSWIGRSASFGYNEAVTYNYATQDGVVVAGKDLSIYYNVLNQGGNQDFSTSAAPFTGVSSANMTAFASGLPLAGTTGPLILGFLSSQGGEIGQWSVVPEPAETTVAVGALVGAFALLRRSRKSVSK
jgi:hypothetical protein